MKKKKGFVKPSGYALDLRYDCPQCTHGTWITSREAKLPGFKVVCCECNQAFDVATIVNTKVKFKFAPECNLAIYKASAILRNCGVDNALDIVKKIYKPGMLVGDVVKQAIIQCDNT